MSRKSNSRASVIVKDAKAARRSAGGAITVLHSGKAGSIRLPVRERVACVPSRHWQRNLERHLVQEGITPVKARSLVKLAAS